MAAHVSDWYIDSKQQEVILIAGKNGLNREISGAHMIEKPELANFTNKNEIIFITGIALANEDEIAQIASGCFSLGASAFAVNTGPYIKEIPQSVIDFCNDNNFPLFSFPWHINVEELIKSLYSIIAEKEKNDDEAKDVFENAILYPERSGMYEYKLRRLGFSPEWKYCVALIHIDDKTVSDYCHALNKLRSHISDFPDLSGKYIYPYISAQNIVVIFANASVNEAENIIRSIISKSDAPNIIFSIGRSTKSVRCLNKSYLLAERILDLKLSGSLPKNIVTYDELGIYKIIIGLENQDILDQINKEYFEPLADYDRLCGTDYTNFIKIYLECNGHINDIADKMFIHKNTVHYKIRKIEEILDCDLSLYEIKMYLMIAVMNHELKQR